MPSPSALVRTGLETLGDFYSPQLDNRRDILIRLPPSYGRSSRRFAVLYFQDGQNLFDSATSYAGDWGLQRVVVAAARRGIEAILVGIPNMGIERLDEYSPFADPKEGGGAGDRYLDFVVETLKPAIDREFRTRPEPAHTGIVGSSMGGLISLYAFFREPSTFGSAGVLSPSLWFAGAGPANEGPAHRQRLSPG
jgi:predicted alpha/beta superfamily hydrolase